MHHPTYAELLPLLLPLLAVRLLVPLPPRVSDVFSCQRECLLTGTLGASDVFSCQRECLITNTPNN